MITQPFAGAGYLLKGFGLINAPGVRRWVVIPLMINVVLFAALFYAAYNHFGQLVDWLMSYLPQWAQDWLAWLLWPLFFIAASVIVFFTFTVVANLVGAPFNGFLAAAVERHLTGRAPAGSGRGLAAEVWHAVKGELRKLLYFAGWALVLLVLSFIPVVNFAVPVLWALFGAWMLALEYLDYPLGNQGRSFPQVRAAVRRRRLAALGFGGTAAIVTLVPLVNFIVMPVAVAGATAFYCRELAEDKQP